MALSDRLQRRLVLLLAAGSLACASAGREGDAIRIADESAIIIWDAATKTQHFIRRATFDTEAKDFGFLVPTPSVPSLAEADDAAFALLARITESGKALKAATVKVAESEPARTERVEVIAREKVAGMDAAVLKTSDAGALDAWLKANGYRSSPELQDWYRPYVTKSWIITAFKIAGGDTRRSGIEGAAIRMSFLTEQPFFPYREPVQPASAAPRLLDVYFLGDSRPEGRIGTSGAWPAKVMWSKPLGDREREQLMKLVKLPPSGASVATRLTRFSDSSSPRRGSDDLFFAAAADQTELSDPITEFLLAERRYKQLYLEILIAIAIAAVIGASIYFLRRRRPAKK